MRTRIMYLGAAVLLAGTWLPLAVRAAGVPLLTLEQAIVLAQSSHPGLQAAVLGVSAADGALLQAGLSPNPELAIVREGAARRSQSVQISQPLELGGKRAARLRVAQLDRAVAVGQQHVRAAELRADVTAAFLEALIAQEQVELAHGALELANSASRAASRRVAAGKVPPLEEGRAQVAAAQARLELAQAQAASTGARRRLAALSGASLAPEQGLAQPASDAMALPPLAALEQRLDQAAPLQQAYRQVQREAAQVQLERAQRMPDLTVTLGAKREADQARAQTVLGLSLPLPLFHRNQGLELAALRRAEQAQAQLEAARLANSQALADAYLRAHSAQQQLVVLRNDIMPAAQRALEAAVTGFELGKFNFLDVLDAQRTLAQARTQYVGAKSSHYRAIADLQRYVPLNQDFP